MAKRKTVSPEQGRFVASLLKHRFPFLGTQRMVDLSDAVSDLAELHELCIAIGKKPDPPRPPEKIWISALIPARAAYIYAGVRLQASLSEEDCYRDLDEWLDLERDSAEAFSIAGTKRRMAEALDNREILLWKVEMQEVSRG